MELKHHPGTPCNVFLRKKSENIPLIDGRWGLEFPSKVEVEVTRRCNLKCTHCWNCSSCEGKDLPEELIRDELAKRKGLYVKFSGGEPFICTYIKELLELCKSNGHYVEINSNGTLIDEDLAKYLPLFINRINISLYGSKRDIHERITRVPGSYDKTINSINMLQKEGLNPVINFTVMRENLKDVRDFILLGKSLNVRSFRLNLLRNCGRAKDLEKITREEFLELKKDLFSIQKNLGVEFERSELYDIPYKSGFEYCDVYGCSGLRNQVFVSSNGDVYPCSLSKNVIGNLNYSSLADIWFSKESFEFRKIFLCPNERCLVKRNCGGKCKA